MRTSLLRCLFVLLLALFISCQKKEEEHVLDHSLSKNCSQLMFEIVDLSNFHSPSIPTIVYVIKDANTRTSVIEILLRNQQKLHEVMNTACVPAAEVIVYDKNKRMALVFYLENSVKREIIDILNKAQVSPIGKSTYGDRGVALPRSIAVPRKYSLVAFGYEITETEFAKIIQHKSKLPVDAEGSLIPERESGRSSIVH
jgi:hypothetical protein